jgi:radical SAM protein with 4Fe4S-binding SPASM domain
MDTDSWKKVIDKIKNESPSNTISFTGGEPLLRKDTVELIRYASTQGFNVNLITNGTMLTEETVKACIDAGVTLFEVPLLAGKDFKEIHDEMAQHPGAWRCCVDAFKTIKKLDGIAVGVIVATKKNLANLKETLETAVVLDLDAVMLNRFNPGGTGFGWLEELLPTAAEFKEALKTAQAIAVDYGLTITSNIPVQPCIIDMSEFPLISGGFCSVGTENAYYAIDSLGNMRPCNHSPTILGNFLEKSFDELMAHPYLQEFIKAYPPICEPCPSASTCQGGCKAAAQVCYGSIYEEEPFFKRNLEFNPMLKEAKEKMMKEKEAQEAK